MSPSSSLTPRTTGAAVFLLALGILVLEVALTRVFSIMTYHHFTYLIVGLALLGFGAAGTTLTTHPRFAGEMRPSVLADGCLLFSVSTMVSFLCITKTSFDAMGIHTRHDFSQLIGLLMLLLLSTAPFFFGGLCLGYVLSKSGPRINRIYAYDLVGAGAGSLLALLGINFVGATCTIFCVGAIASLAAVLVGRSAAGRTRRRDLLVLMAALALTLLTLVRDSAVPIPFPPSKLPNYFALEYAWHVVARVDVLPPGEGYPSFGGALSQVWDKTHPPMTYRGVYQDGAAFTGIMKLEGSSPDREEILGHYLQSAAFVLQPRSSALVIGPGGGVDVAMALHQGSSKVFGVDINPRTIDFVRDTFNDFAGGLFRRPDVNIVCAEGRHYLTTTDEKFDVIQLSGVDTFTALASGAYALSENYLYTLEAMADYFSHLTDDGIASFSRWMFTPPRESLRLAVTARMALERRGIAEPSRHIVVLSAPAWYDRSPWAVTLVKLKPFSPQELETLRAWADRLRFDLIYDPFVPYEPGRTYSRLEATPEYRPEECAREFHTALRAPADELIRFMDGYRYDIHPSTDDKPFFFNYYRLRELRHPFSATLGGDPVNRMPLGLMVLGASSLTVVSLSILFIAIPLRKKASALGGVRGRWPVLIYFSCIGLAFIAVEIMLMQKLMVFVGGPVYAMSVTLFSLLVFCGVGSALSSRLTQRNTRAAGAILIALMCLILVGVAAYLPAILAFLMPWSHPARCAAAVGLLLPVGLFMGAPFPTGLKLARQLNAALAPWAWCVNACATVLGSVLSIVLALFFGFTIVLYLGAALYGVALLSMLGMPTPRLPTTACSSLSKGEAPP